MKNILLSSILISSLFSSASVFAEDTAPINSTATVQAGCTFIDKDVTLDFGVIKGQIATSDPAYQASLVKSSGLRFECTNGVQATVTVPNPSGNLVNAANPGQSIGYTVSNQAGTSSYTAIGRGYGDPVPLLFNYKVTLSSGQVSNAPIGLYEGSFIVVVVN